MLTKKEIIDYAKINNITPHQQEKHYVQSLILSAISEEKIIFKGGTYLWFFHGLPRFSEDLDFTATCEVKNLEKKVINYLALFDVSAKIKKKDTMPEGFSFRVDVAGPLYENELSKNFVYVEISKRNDLINKPINLILKNTNYLIHEKNVMGMDLDEVASEKIRAIMTRNKPRDVFDLNFLINEKNIYFNKSLIQKKLDYYGEKFSKKKFEIALKNKNKSYLIEMNYLLNSKPPKFEEAQKNILNWIEGIK
jgi:predicted nucleotidyltransferase component of viral defense system